MDTLSRSIALNEKLYEVLSKVPLELAGELIEIKKAVNERKLAEAPNNSIPEELKQNPVKPNEAFEKPKEDVTPQKPTKEDLI